MAGRSERLEPLTGVVAVALWVVAVFVIESARPEDEDSPAALLTYFDEERTTLTVGAILFALGTAFFVWFLGSLRAAFLSGEGMPGRITAIAFGAGIGKAVFDIATAGMTAAGTIAAQEELTPEGAQVFFWAEDAFIIGAEFMALVFMIAAGVVILRTRVLPVWLGALALVIALGLLIVPVGWAFLLFGVPLWVLIASVLLYLRGTRQPAGELLIAT